MAMAELKFPVTGPLFLWEELQLWRNIVLGASVLENPEPLSFGMIQEVVQVDIGVEQNVYGGHEI